MGSHQTLHGDGVKDIAFSVEDCRSIYKVCVNWCSVASGGGGDHGCGDGIGSGSGGGVGGGILVAYVVVVVV